MNMVDFIVGLIIGCIICLFLWPYFSLTNLKQIADELEKIRRILEVERREHE